MEPVQKICPKPKCERNPLVEVELERTMAFQKFACTKCSAVYNVPTAAGQAAQMAPLVLAGAAIIGIATTLLTGHGGHHSS